MRFGRIMPQAMQASGANWHSARSGQALVLVRSYEADPRIAAATSVPQAVEPALAEARSRPRA